MSPGLPLDRRGQNVNETPEGYRKLRVAIRRDRGQAYLEWSEPEIVERYLEEPDEVLVRLRQLVDRRFGADSETIGFLAFDRETDSVDHLDFKVRFRTVTDPFRRRQHFRSLMDAADGRWSR